ncbi:hypothetical protein B296_00045910, partial [Ensete ventricosum]
LNQRTTLLDLVPTPTYLSVLKALLSNHVDFTPIQHRRSEEPPKAKAIVDMAQAAVAVAPVRHSPWPRLSSLFSSGKHPQHLFFSVARALRPLAPQALEGDGDGEPDAPAVKKSRNELKREARRAVKWGMELASFSNPQIKRVLRFLLLLPPARVLASLVFVVCFIC